VDSSLNRFMGAVFNDLAMCVGGVPAPVRVRRDGSQASAIVLHLGGRLDTTGFDKALAGSKLR